MTGIQEIDQADGPHRPTARQLCFVLGKIPSHLEIRAVSINGQANTVAIETCYEGLEEVHRFTTSDFYDIPPN